MELTKPQGYGTLHVGGQERPFHVGTHQADTFCRLRGLSLKEYSDLFSPKTLAEQKVLGGDISDFLYSSLVAGAEWDGLRVDFNPLIVRSWVDDADEEEVLKPLQAMLDQTVRRATRAVERLGNAPAPQPTTGGKKPSKKKAA